MSDIQTDRKQFVIDFKKHAKTAPAYNGVNEADGPKHIDLFFEEEQRVGDMLAGGAKPKLTPTGNVLRYIKEDLGMLRFLFIAFGILLGLVLLLISFTPGGLHR